MASEVVRFKFTGGDGDPSFFDNHFTAIKVEEKWFSGTLPRGEAWLLRIENGKLEGKFIAVTARNLASFDEQLSKSNYVGVTVHYIKKPGDDFKPDDAHADPVGMTYVERIFD